MSDRIKSLMDKKKIDYIIIDGSTKQEKRYENVMHFQNEKSCQAAILKFASCSTGITLTAAHIVIFAELTWTPSIMKQAEDRVYRIGQKNKSVFINYLYGKETLDDFMLDKLQKKLFITSTIIDDKKEYFGVKPDATLIDPEGTYSKKLIRIDNGELKSYDDDNNNGNENEDEDKNEDEEKNEDEDKNEDEGDISKKIFKDSEEADEYESNIEKKDF